jgi:hypothetical protein
MDKAGCDLTGAGHIPLQINRDCFESAGIGSTVPSS